MEGKIMSEEEYYDYVYEIICETIPPQTRLTLFNAIFVHRFDLLSELMKQKGEDK